MSGIVAIINLDGAPVERPLLERMTGFMAFRGPDAQTVWSDGPVGFGHAMLRTTWEAQTETQPGTLDGRVWITAHARVDGRADLIAKLTARGHSVPPGAPDSELILHAYNAWGESCVEHLLGDFAFAIWDGPRRRLFCARDHFGARPFFYARVGDHLLVSNTLGCLRLHPAVSNELNDLAIYDFLVFGGNPELDTTAFADVSRLPPAHTLTWSESGLRLACYWELTERETIRYQRKADYIEQFLALFEEAVADRLRTARVGVLMSGGLDSAGIAAVARRQLAAHHAGFELHAHTVVYNHLIPDRERYYSGLVAKHLGIPIHYLAADDYRLFERWGSDELRRPEPSGDPLAAINVDLMRYAASRSRVVLTGWDADTALLTSSLKRHFAPLLRAGELGQAVVDLSWYLWARLRWTVADPDRLKRRFDAWKRRCTRRGNPVSCLPPWLDRSFAARFDFARREQEIAKKFDFPRSSPRSYAYHHYRSPIMPQLLETLDAGFTFRPLEIRNPFLDRRLLEFLLTLPQLPWCYKKTLYRTAFKGLLPGQVCRRPKSPASQDPVEARMRQPRAPWTIAIDAAPELKEFVDLEAMAAPAATKRDFAAWGLLLPPLALNHWLRSMAQPRDPLHRGDPLDPSFAMVLCDT
jgi:asparagine synthase (glutamine-hydrolysing)